MSRTQTVLGPLNASERGTILGHYRAIASTSAAAFASNAALASVQWIAGAAATGFQPNPNATAPTVTAQVMVVERVYLGITVVTAVTAQRIDPFALVVQRSFTAPDSTNATAVTLTTNNAKARTKFATSQLGAAGSFVVASAAAGVSGGVKTADANPFAIGDTTAAVTGLGSGGACFDIYRANLIESEYPLILANNEGFTVQWGATALATGTVVMSVGLEWAEVVYY